VTVGSAAPDFRAASLDGSGRVKGIADYRGEVVLINLWATWCGPCVAELPLIARLHRELDRPAAPLELAFVSVDADDGAVARFRAAHPDAPAGPRLVDADSLSALLRSVGLDEAAPIPVHLFVGADDRVVCARAGALREEDLPAVRALLR
jgi:thiol-disulfide isomerase/thioredoxin